MVVLFVGNLAYEPNANGVGDFIRQAWPRVRAALPEAVLRLVGTPPPPDVRQQWQAAPGVEVTGFVENLADVYDAAAITIAPLTWGGGTSIKVLESLAHARACVLTARTLAGFRSFLRHDESVWCAADVAAMADGCIRLLRDPEMRNAMAERGRRAVAEHASIAGFQRTVRRTLELIVQRQAPRIAVETQ
jgi:glycosyltransferase involved in cell wall biosynthesis